MTYLWPILLLPAALAIPPAVPNGSISSSATTSHPTYITTTTTTELTTVVAGTVLVTSVVTVEPCLSTTLGLPSQDHNSAQHSSSEGGEHGFEFDTWSPGMPTATTLFRDGGRDGGGGGSSGSDPRALTRGSSTAIYAGTSSDNLALGTSSSSSAAAAVSIATSDPLAIHGTGSTAGGISSTSTQDPLAVGPSGSLPGSITSSSSATNSQDHLAISTPSSVIGISSSATSPRSSTTSVHGPGPFGISSSAALLVKPSSQTATASGPSTNWTYASPVQPSATPLSTVTPCMQNKTDAGLQACRLALGTTCDRSSNEYPTCVNGQCACQAVECASDGECVGFRQCFADETASCKFSNSSSSSSSSNATSASASSSVSSSSVTIAATSRSIMNITSAIIAAGGPGKAMTTSSSRGVCQCQPKGGGCLVQRDPDRYCAEHAPCSDPSVNGAFPAHAQCVMQDAFGFYLFGRCKCQTVDCPWAWPAVPDNARKNRDSCAKLILCKDDEAPTTPMCVAKPWGPSPMRHDPATRGYCACVGR